MTGDDDLDGYRGDLSRNAVTIAEVLKNAGYGTYMSGKWHVCNSLTKSGNWPNDRGFDDHYGIITGCCSYYTPPLKRNGKDVAPERDDYFFTDAISDEAVRQIKEHNVDKPEKPFFQYVAYTAPHWPLHAPAEDIAKYKGRYDKGWDAIREERVQRMIELGILHQGTELSARDPSQPPWDEAEHKEWQARRMEVYAAQIDRMDQGIGRILGALEETEQLQNTLIVFLADNGGCAEELSANWAFLQGQTTRDGGPVQLGNDPAVMPGSEDTYQSYGVPWANVSNTPFRLYKHWVHEGGIATPFIVHWPDGIKARGELRHQPAQLPDVMATFLDIAGVDYPEIYDDKAIKPLEGFSMVRTFTHLPHKRKVLYWEHEGNKAVRKGKWKLVCRYPGKWELYDMEIDRTERDDISGAHPDILQELSGLYNEWAKRCEVTPWDELNEHRKRRSAATEQSVAQKRGEPRA